jgi:hypothetical protein
LHDDDVSFVVRHARGPGVPSHANDKQPTTSIHPFLCYHMPKRNQPCDYVFVLADYPDFADWHFILTQKDLEIEIMHGPKNVEMMSGRGE